MPCFLRQPWPAASSTLALLLILWAGPQVLAGDPNACDHPSESPDVIVGEIDEVVYWGSVGGKSAFSFSTWSCNVGTCELDWFSNTNQHPVIAQNMFRLKDGRFEHIGQSWLKHGFFALSLELCDTGCIPTNGTHLGVNCADPYTADLNGNQPGLGPKSEVNPTTGGFPYPFTEPGGEVNDIFKRLQVETADVATALNPGARYYVEGQYITHDDAAAGNDDNNASYRRVTIEDDAGFTLTLQDEIVREQPAIYAWAAEDSQVSVRSVVTGDGRFFVASKVTGLPGGLWQYEYAVQNLNSRRSAKAFRVPVPSGAQITAIGFHDVDYHSGEPFDGTDWSAGLEAGGAELVWRTENFNDNNFANALRWGTLYNFRFTANVAPDDRPQALALEFFRTGLPVEFSVLQTAPNPCNNDGTCDEREDCLNCAADCQAPGESCCGDLICEGDEDGCGCPDDCGDCFSGGRVPDGGAIPGKPLTLALSADASELVLDWDRSCLDDDTDYEIYRGLIGNFATHQRFVCTTGGATTTTVPTPSFNAYYLIAPTNGLTEGSLGTDSQGLHRSEPPTLQACHPRLITSCAEAPPPE